MVSTDNPDTYQYDVFISYTRNQVGDWLHEHFLDFFKSHLYGSLGYQPRLFIDSEDIAAGESWPLRLQTALAHSKCLVAMWSPAYFASYWCLQESNVMFNREAQLDYRTLSNPRGLVLPIKVQDGQHFPEYARHIQCPDFRKFFRTGSGFRKTERYIDFQDKISHWTDDVAQAILEAPPWQEEWINMETTKVLEISEPNFNTPPRLG